MLPRVSDKVDYEAELAVVIGTPVRHADAASGRAAIAGYTVLNDVSVRDCQNRTKQFLQGKTFEHSTPLGPVAGHAGRAARRAAGRSARALDGETMQDSTTDQLVFARGRPGRSTCPTILTLNPGDVIATGTPGRGRPRPQAPALPHRRRRAGRPRSPASASCRNTCRAGERDPASGAGRASPTPWPGRGTAPRTCAG